MADLNVCNSPDILTTLGLGSCVGIVLYDTVNHIGGLAHAMLPDSTQIRNNSNFAKFVDTATKTLLENMLQEGANRKYIHAKLAGGAQMFKFSGSNDLMKIGERNVIAAKKMLKELNIRLLAEDTGENYGRTIELNSSDGSLLIKTIGKGTKWI